MATQTVTKAVMDNRGQIQIVTYTLTNGMIAGSGLGVVTPTDVLILADKQCDLGRFNPPAGPTYTPPTGVRPAPTLSEHSFPSFTGSVIRSWFLGIAARADKIHAEYGKAYREWRAVESPGSATLNRAINKYNQLAGEVGRVVSSAQPKDLDAWKKALKPHQSLLMEYLEEKEALTKKLLEITKEIQKFNKYEDPWHKEFLTILNKIDLDAQYKESLADSNFNSRLSNLNSAKGSLNRLFGKYQSHVSDQDFYDRRDYSEARGMQKDLLKLAHNVVDADKAVRKYIKGGWFW